MRSDRPSSSSGQEHSRLLKALRESELLRELSELLASSLDPTHILQVLVKRTTEVCDVERCAVWLLDADHHRFHPSAYHLATPHIQGKQVLQIADRVWRHSSLPFNDPVIHRLLHEKGMLVLEDLSSEASMRTIAEKFVVRSILLIALVREGRVVGMMSLDNPGKDTTFSREQQQLVRAIGQQAAVAIDNAQLYQQAQDERSHAQRLSERSQAIYQVAIAVNSGEDLPQVLEIAVEQLRQGTQGNSAAIVLLERGALVLASATRLPTPTSTTGKHPSPVVTTLPYCHSAITQESMLFVTCERMSDAEKCWFAQLGMENVLIVPLMVATHNKHEHEETLKTPAGARYCVGFAFVNYKQHSSQPGKGKRTFARDIAAQCALAIEKAQILREARQAVALATERANALDAVFNAMSEGIIALDLNGQAILNNKLASRFVSMAPNIKKHLPTYLKHNPAFTLYGQPIAAEDHPLMRALRGERIRGERLLTRRRDNPDSAIEVNIAPLFDSKNTQIGIVSAFRDISEQVQTEQRIRFALDTMLHAAEAVSGLTDIREISYRVLAMTLAALNCERGVVELYNQEEQHLTPLLSIGFALGEAEPWLARQQSWLQPAANQYAGFYAQLLDGHATLVDAEQDSNTEPDPAPTLILAAPITHSNRLLGVMLLDRSVPSIRKKSAQTGTTGLLTAPEFNAWDMAVVEGIGEFAGLAMAQTHWKNEAEIARINEASMRESNALKDEFLAITAHEFRTPLTVILAHSQMMGRRIQKSVALMPTEIKGKLDESINSIEEQTRQLTNIVNTFLEVTRLNRGQITLNQVEIRLEDVIQETITHHSATLTNHEIRYRIEPCERPYLLLGDKARLLQIFANLLQNAIKYSPLGGPITISLMQLIDEEGQAMSEVCIEDKGIGVPKDAQPYLFDRFYRASNIGGSQARGVGLGLYVVAEFLRLHGGKIRVESNGVEGEGSRFIFTLPLLEKDILTDERTA